MWACIESDDNVELHITLPQTWKNFSNFNALVGDEDFLKTLGWYRVVDTSEPITNDSFHYHGPARYHLDETLGVVIKHCDIVQYDMQALSGERLASSKAVFLSDLRARRDNLLRESDWTQGADLQSAKGNDWVAAWAEYRRLLRDLPSRYEQEPYLSVVDSNQVEWPTRPGA